jgi:hypothetical protein
MRSSEREILKNPGLGANRGLRLTGGLRPAGPPIAVARGGPLPRSAPAGRAYAKKRVSVGLGESERL